MPTEHLETSHFAFETVDRPEVPDGEVLCRVLWLSIDAAQRAWLQAATYRSAVQIGDTMPGFALAQVVESRCDDFAAGDIVSGDLAWQDYVVAKPSDLSRIVPKRPLSNYLSVLGITGLTAYFGLLDVGEAKPGDTVVVSGAAGATSRNGSHRNSDSTRQSAIVTSRSVNRCVRHVPMASTSISTTSAVRLWTPSSARWPTAAASSAAASSRSTTRARPYAVRVASPGC
jgi:N-terminal domain of oxidoreductase